MAIRCDFQVSWIGTVGGLCAKEILKMAFGLFLITFFIKKKSNWSLRRSLKKKLCFICLFSAHSRGGLVPFCLIKG
jgi:hypothetical protein